MQTSAGRHSRTTLVALAVVALLSGLSSAKAQIPFPVPPRPREPDVTIYRAMSFLDPELAERKLGRLSVAVRPADEPTRPAVSAIIDVRMSERDSLRRITDSTGRAVFDSVRSGYVMMTVRRIGFGGVRVEIPIPAGCRVDVEVYVPLLWLGQGSIPEMEGRVVVTTCR